MVESGCQLVRSAADFIIGDVLGGRTNIVTNVCSGLAIATVAALIAALKERKKGLM